MIKLGSCFTGIGAWEKGLKNMGIEYDLQWFFENDKYPATAYCAIHEENINKNKWDITKADVNKLSDIDMLVYSPPCQAFSIAGKQLGTKDPRGQLFYHTMPIIRSKKPKICIMENVKGLVGKNFTELFKDMLNCLENIGYNNYFKILNAKDYGIPQNRERIFIVSIRKDVDSGDFRFPKPFDNGLRLKDMLDERVNEKYYINKEFSIFNKKLDTQNNELVQAGKLEMKGNECIKRFYAKDGICPTLTTMGGGNMEPKILGNGKYIQSVERIPLKFKNRNGKYTDGKYSFCVDTSNTGGIKENYANGNYAVRKLTPRECWRLMGFDDIDYGTGKQALEQTFYKGKDRSDSRMYKMAGNSVVVKTIECIYKKLFKVINL